MQPKASELIIIQTFIQNQVREEIHRIKESFSSSRRINLNIQALLGNLIKSAHQRWTYSIFWCVSHSGQGSLLGWGDGYYHREEYKEKKTNLNSSSSSLLIRVNPELTEPKIFAKKWFLLSTTQSFAEGSGLPGQAWQSSFPVWITGRENLASSSCERARKAQEHWVRTLVFIPSETGVIELGSTALNFQTMDLVNNALQLLNFIYSSEMFQPVRPGDESESSNSIGNNAIVGSNSHVSDEDEELSLGLHLGFKAWPVKPKNESKSSTSSVGNDPLTVVKENEKPQFSGKLQVGSDNDSDSSDINAFVHILKGRRG